MMSRSDAKAAYPAEYEVWKGIRARCRNPKHKWFCNYGGRGIDVCPRWESFAAFIADMKPRPTPQHTIERENNALGYSPENCKWVTRLEQMANVRNNRMVTFNGEKMHLSEACRRAGLEQSLVAHRLRLGWPEDRLFEPSRGRKRVAPAAVRLDGETMTVTEACRRLGLDPHTVSARMVRGATVEEALNDGVRHAMTVEPR